MTTINISPLEVSMLVTVGIAMLSMLLILCTLLYGFLRRREYLTLAFETLPITVPVLIFGVVWIVMILNQ